MAEKVKNRPDSAAAVGSIPERGRFPRGENGNSLQFSSLENPMGREAWQAIVHGVTKNQT